MPSALRLARHFGISKTAARLKEITVDPKTVALQKKIDAGSIKTPAPASDLAAGSWSYAAKISMGGQSMQLGQDLLLVFPDRMRVVVQSPMGEQTVVVAPRTHR